VAQQSVKSLLLDELATFVREQDEPDYRKIQIADWVYKKRAGSFEEMTDLPQLLRERFAANFRCDRIETVRTLGSKDTTQKFLFRLTDGNLIESVLIPASPALYLQPDEIVDQLMAVEDATGEKIDNVVFMGMGEPLANFENVMRSIKIMNAPWALGIGARHITVSTSGLAPQIRRLAEEGIQVRLAVSLHGATDEVRGQIMPINRKYDIATLLAACDYYASRKKQHITFEYILIAGINDAEGEAHALAGHARRLKAKVNLIPYNTVQGLPWLRPSRSHQERFLAILREHHVGATLRREKGCDIDAACGQLRLQTARERLLGVEAPIAGR
jgi:23S rRNA (adenine2503-C2)-methyltransferase